MSFTSINMKNKILIGIGIFIAVVLISGCTQAPQTADHLERSERSPRGLTPQTENEIPFKTIAKGEYSGYIEKANLVINDEKTFSEIWNGVNKITTPLPAEPKIDFSNETVIAVFLGEKNTGGHSIEIKKIVVEFSECPEKTLCKGVVTYIVHYKEIAPKQGSLVTQALTQPYHIVKTQNLGKAEFKKVE